MDHPSIINLIKSFCFQEANKLVYSAFHKAKEILESNKDDLNLLSKTLLKNETLQYADIEKLIGPPKFGDKRKVIVDSEVILSYIKE